MRACNRSSFSLSGNCSESMIWRIFSSMVTGAFSLGQATLTFLVLAGYYFVACASLIYAAHRIEMFIARRRVQPAGQKAIVADVVEIAG